MLRDFDFTFLHSNLSDQGADSEEDGRARGHLEGEVGLLVHGHESGLVEVLVLLVFIVNQVGGESFHSVVDSVAANVLAGLLHEVLGPVLVPVTSVG